MSLFFQRRHLPTGNALARGFLATATAISMLPICIGIQGCIENPGTDHRLVQRNRDYQVIATAKYAEESVLELSVKHDSGVIKLRILSTAREPIDSASFLLQFGERNDYSAPMHYRKDSRLNVIVRIADLQPGDILDYGPISREMDLERTVPSAKLIRFADGAPRGNPLGGVYSGNYSIQETAGRRETGPMKGIITAEGEYHFLTETVFMNEGIKGDFYGMLDTIRKEGFLYSENNGRVTHITTLPAPFALDSGTLTGTFRFTQSLPWLDSLGFEMDPMRYIGE